MGDTGETLYLLLVSNPGIRLMCNDCTSAGAFEMDSAELMTVPGEAFLQHADIKAEMVEVIRNNQEEIKASK